MSWAALIQTILALLEPVLQDWLKRLLEREPTSAVPASEEEAVGEVFATARRQLWPWQFGRRATLAAAERACRRRAWSLAKAAQGHTVVVPILLTAERVELGGIA